MARKAISDRGSIPRASTKVHGDIVRAGFGLRRHDLLIGSMHPGGSELVSTGSDDFAGDIRKATTLTAQTINAKSNLSVMHGKRVVRGHAASGAFAMAA